MLTAWADESGSIRADDPGAYLFGVALVEPEHFDGVRAAVGGLRLRSQKKLHWRDESEKRRHLVVKTIASLPLQSLVVIRVGPVDDKDERRRRKCFEVLLPEVARLGCATLTLESRGRHLDELDMKVVAALRTQHVVSSSIRVNHVAGPAEPLLWVADALCGAYVAHRTSRGSYFDLLAERTRIVNIQT